MNATTEEVASAMNQMTKGVTSQTQRIEETYKIMKNMAKSLKDVGIRAEKAAASSENASQKVNLSGTKMVEMSEKINLISDTVSSAVELMKVLGERSQQIGEITETITTIADQTNLLSLNAAIEAARAGEAGRGFAVVAEEVRKLAENSAQAAYRIGKLIKTVQVEVNKTIEAIELGSQEVIDGRKISGSVSEVLRGVITTVTEAANAAKDIANAIEGQLTDTDRVIKAVDEMSSVSQQSSSAVEQTSSSVEEQTASVQEVASSAQELAHMASKMKDLILKFKL